MAFHRRDNHYGHHRHDEYSGADGGEMKCGHHQHIRASLIEAEAGCRRLVCGSVLLASAKVVLAVPNEICRLNGGYDTTTSASSLNPARNMAIIYQGVAPRL